MNDTLSYLLSGLIFGLVAGISPGPLFTLLVSETVKYNKKAGIKVAFAPLVTDTPIVILSIYLISTINIPDKVFGLISFTGAGFITLLAVENLKLKQVNLKGGQAKNKSLQKAILTNFFNPHPYIFWLTVGSPIVFKASQVGDWPPIAYITGFYVIMILSKVIIALIVDKSKRILNSKGYIIVLRILGFILLFFALLFVKDGFAYIN